MSRVPGFRILLAVVLLGQGAGATTCLASSVMLFAHQHLTRPEGKPSRAAEVFAKDELWTLPDAEEWRKIISQLPESLRPAAVPLEALTPEERERINLRHAKAEQPFYRYFRVTPELRQTLPLNFWQAIYAHLGSEDMDCLGPVQRFTTEQDFRAWAKTHELSPEQTEAVLRKIIIAGNHGYLPLVPETKELLPAPFVAKLQSPAYWAKPKIRQNLVGVVRLTEESAAEIARAYAGPRNPEAIEKYLRAQLKASGRRELTFPVSKLLPAFARKNLGAFESAAEGNCFNSGLCSAQPSMQKDRRFVGGRELVERLNQEFRPVAAGGPLQTGDLILYSARNEQGNLYPVHAATYVGQGRPGALSDPEPVVFTKNGYNPERPYILQTQREMEAEYFPKKDFVMTVHRPIPTEEARRFVGPPSRHLGWEPYVDFSCAKGFRELPQQH